MSRVPAFKVTAGLAGTGIHSVNPIFVNMNMEADRACAMEANGKPRSTAARAQNADGIKPADRAPVSMMAVVILRTGCPSIRAWSGATSSSLNLTEVFATPPRSTVRLHACLFSKSALVLASLR